LTHEIYLFLKREDIRDSDQRSRLAVKEGTSNLDPFLWSCDPEFSNLSQARLERDEIRILYLESGTSVHLEELRTILGDDPVECEISEVGVGLYLSGIGQDEIPEWEYRIREVLIRGREGVRIDLSS
jgi:hypothetical protein